MKRCLLLLYPFPVVPSRAPAYRPSSVTGSGTAHILAQLASGKLTQEQALAQLKTAPKSNGGPLSCKQSEKGGVTVYGLQRMPVTLYAEQWERLLGFAEEVKGFIKSHPGSVPQAAELDRGADSPCPTPSNRSAGEWAVLIGAVTPCRRAGHDDRPCQSQGAP